METKLHPNVIREIERGELHRNWATIKTRLEAAEGSWVLVLTTEPEANAPGITKQVKEELRRVNCRAQVVALKGMMVHQRPWSGWAVFACLPR